MSGTWRDAREDWAHGYPGLAATVLNLAYKDSRHWKEQKLREWLYTPRVSLFCELINVNPAYLRRKFLEETK